MIGAEPECYCLPEILQWSSEYVEQAFNLSHENTKNGFSVETGVTMKFQ
jgi:hypothetical protein